jgi:hypothetical protein
MAGMELSNIEKRDSMRLAGDDRCGEIPREDLAERASV